MIQDKVDLLSGVFGKISLEEWKNITDEIADFSSTHDNVFITIETYEDYENDVSLDASLFIYGDREETQQELIWNELRKVKSEISKLKELQESYPMFVTSNVDEELYRLRSRRTQLQTQLDTLDGV